MINILLCNVCIVVSLWLFCKSLMSRKYHHYIHEFLLFLWMCLSSFSGFLWLRVIGVILGVVWYVGSKYIASIWFLGIVDVLYCLGLVLSECLCASVFYVVNGIYANDYRIGEYTMLVCLSFIVLFIWLYFSYHIICSYKCKRWLKGSCVLFVLPITSMVVFLNIEDYFRIFEHHVLVVIGLLGIVVSNILLFILHHQLVQMSKWKGEYLLLHDKYDALHDLYQSSSRFIHDVSRSVFKLKNKYNVQEVNELCNVLFQQFHNEHTDCVSLRKVLMQYKDVLLENQIDVKCDMQVCDGVFDEALFSGLLKCGIASCCKVKGSRSILFSSYGYQRIVICKCAFSSVEKVYVDCIPSFVRVCSEFVSGFCEITMMVDRGCI